MRRHVHLIAALTAGLGVGYLAPWLVYLGLLVGPVAVVLCVWTACSTYGDEA